MSGKLGAIIENRFMPEGWIAFDEGETIFLAGPEFGIRVPKPIVEIKNARLRYLLPPFEVE